jgi:hypothetical protein
VVRVDPVTGARTVLATGAPLVLPLGLALAPSGQAYVADVASFVGQTSRVVSVNPQTGVPTLVSSNANLKLPGGLAVENSGTLLVADAGSMLGAFPDMVLRINPTNGQQTVLSASNLLAGPIGLAVQTNGVIFAVNMLNARIIQIDPVSGVQSLFASGGELVQPTAIAIVPNLSIVPNPRLYRLVRIVPAPGSVELEFQGLAGHSYALERSSNFSTWDQITVAVAAVDGLVQFVDPAPLAGGAFYRVRWP